MLALLQNSNDDSSGSRAGSVVAHALEFLERRLDRQAYYATQQIHYPGSTARIDDAKKGA